MNALYTTNSITYAGSRQKKTASCFFQISGGWTTKEHEVRTGHTVERYAQACNRPGSTNNYVG